MKRSLSVQEWYQMSQEGTGIPIRIPLMGWSMYPLVRYNKDYVTVMPIDDELRIGDIVLFPDYSRKDVYVMHRVWSIKDNMVLTWGDNCKEPDNWMPESEILGKAILIERGKRKIQPDPQRGIRWAKFWHQAGKFRRLYKRYMDGLMRRIKK